MNYTYTKIVKQTRRRDTVKCTQKENKAYKYLDITCAEVTRGITNTNSADGTIDNLTYNLVFKCGAIRGCNGAEINILPSSDTADASLIQGKSKSGSWRLTR